MRHSPEMDAQLKVSNGSKFFFFVNLYYYFVISLNHQNMSSKYQITQDRISDAITRYTKVITQIPRLKCEHLRCLPRQYIECFKEEFQKACDYSPIKL